MLNFFHHHRKTHVPVAPVRHILFFVSVVIRQSPSSYVSVSVLMLCIYFQVVINDTGSIPDVVTNFANGE